MTEHEELLGENRYVEESPGERSVPDCLIQRPYTIDTNTITYTTTATLKTYPDLPNSLYYLDDYYYTPFVPLTTLPTYITMGAD